MKTPSETVAMVSIRGALSVLARVEPDTHPSDLFKVIDSTREILINAQTILNEMTEDKGSNG